MDIIQPLTETPSRPRHHYMTKAIFLLIVLGAAGYGVYYVLKENLIPGLSLNGSSNTDDVTKTGQDTSIYNDIVQDTVQPENTIQPEDTIKPDATDPGKPNKPGPDETGEDLKPLVLPDIPEPTEKPIDAIQIALVSGIVLFCIFVFLGLYENRENITTYLTGISELITQMMQRAPEDPPDEDHGEWME